MNSQRQGQPSRPRFAFTLVELLVVLAIIGILMAILLPAIQQARESGRRLQCQNHLKQIGLAFHHHHDQLGYFPTGGWGWWEPPTYVNSSPAVGAGQGAGWAFQILPYMEAREVWSGGLGPTDLDRILVAVGTTNSNFFCPTRRKAQSVTYSDPGFLGGQSVKHALCDFAASNLDGTGIVRRYEPHKFADILDGTSTTMLVGEKRLNRRTLGEWQEDDNEGYAAGWDEDTMRRSDLPPLRDYSAAVGDGDERFGGTHSNGINIVLADGSVQFVAYTIDAKVFQYLGEINDAQSISPF